MAGKYIELVGVAGAGKTAIAKILVDEALRREVAISPRVVGRTYGCEYRLYSPSR